jgi:hypothetical protein
MATKKKIVEETSGCVVETKRTPKKKKCKVVSYNKYSNVIVYLDTNGKLIQTNTIEYDNSGYVCI